LGKLLARLNTHLIGYSGLGSIIGAVIAIVLVGAQSAVDDHLVGNGFFIEAARGVYDAFVRYAAMPVILTLVAAGGLAAYFGKPKTIPGKTDS
jgi:hypothetical protein